MSSPTVSVVIPVLDEAEHIARTLASVDAQTYANIVEILVVDGGSTDDTVSIAARNPRVRVLDNPGRMQAAGLNIGLDAAVGAVIVRVDGHCQLASDYVERAVATLTRTGAAMVGGAMTPVGTTTRERSIAIAMSSRLGAGPARFHVGGREGEVDTVYLGVFRRDLARQVGGYAEDVGVNEDAELAIRMAPHGGIWFDPAIRSTYAPRPGFTALARQFFRYGRSRAATVRRHPGSLRPRQLATPLLLAGLMSPWRGYVAAAYLVVVGGRALAELPRAPEVAPALALALPTMHGSWALGFVVGALTTAPGPRPHAPARAVRRSAVREVPAA
jgi:succinoglycan biosynthesis protein ExoA